MPLTFKYEESYTPEEMTVVRHRFSNGEDITAFALLSISPDAKEITLVAPSLGRNGKITNVDFVIPYMTTHGMGSYRKLRFLVEEGKEPQAEFRKSEQDNEPKVIAFSEILTAYINSLQAA